MSSGVKKQKQSSLMPKMLSGVQYSVDFITAVLLLTGQITTVGVYIVSDGFLLAGTGPIIGGERLEGLSQPASLGLDVIDVINALLLIIGQVRVTGPYITSGRLFIVWTGEIFGHANTVTKTPTQQMLAEYLKKQLLHRNYTTSR